MPYNPSLHNTQGKSTGLWGTSTADARSYYYDTTTYTYRPYDSQSEVLSYLNTSLIREGNFPIYIQEDSKVLTYWFKDGTDDSDLVLFIPIATASIPGIVKPGTNLTIESDGTLNATGGGSGGDGTVTSVAMSVPTGLTVTGSPITTHGTLALTYTTGYSIPTTAKQAYWDSKSDFSGSYTDLTDKPTIPTVNNATLTLSTSGIATGSQTFTANSATNKTFTVTVPSTLSSYTNDVGFAAINDSSSSSTSTYSSEKINSLIADAGGGDMLKSVYDPNNIAGDAFDYDNLINAPTIPAAQVNSDWNSTTGLSKILNKPTLFSGDYNDLTNTPTIPAQFNPTEGTGIDISGTYPNLTITNSQPDQTVTLTEGDNITITGTYPDFTISSTGSYTLPTASTTTLGGVKIDGISITIDNGVISAPNTGAGSVTSVGLSLPSTIFSVTNSPVTTTGTLTAVYKSQTKNTVFAASSTANSVPSFRALVIADLPTVPTTHISGLSTVATSGSYTDLSDQPTIPNAQVSSDWDATTGVAKILNKPTLFSGDYTDLTNKPTIPDQFDPNEGTGISITGTYPNLTITNSKPDKTVSLTEGDNITITGTYPNFTIASTAGGTGTVTSVAATVPTGFSISGSPITTSGTLALSFASGYSLPSNSKQATWTAKFDTPTGTTSQYIRGNGTLATFPTIPTNNNQLTNGKGYITSYTETDTLQTVTSRGNHTTENISVGASSLLGWDSTSYNAVQVGQGAGFMAGGSAYAIYLAANAYFNGTGWKVAKTDSYRPAYLRVYDGSLSLISAAKASANTAFTSNVVFNVDPSGNTALGVNTAKSFGSTYTSLQIGPSSFMTGTNASGSIALYNNVYYNGSTWIAGDLTNDPSYFRIIDGGIEYTTWHGQSWTSGSSLGTPTKVFSLDTAGKATATDLVTTNVKSATSLATDANGKIIAGTAGVGGNFASKLVTVSSDYDVLVDDDVVLIDATGGDIVINIPAAASSNTKQIYRFSQYSPNGNQVQYRDGEGTRLVTRAVEDFFTVISDGSRWWILVKQ